MKPILIAFFIVGAFCWGALFVEYLVGNYEPSRWFVAFMLFSGFFHIVDRIIKMIGKVLKERVENEQTV